MSKAGTYSNQGDDYQRAIAINWIIELLTNNEIEYIQVESNGLKGIKEKVTVDDIVIVYKNCKRRHIQVKKNQTNERVWSIKDWGNELPKILYQLEQGEHITVELYSSTPLGEFTTLPKECCLFQNFSDFKEALSEINSKALSLLVKEWDRPEIVIFNLLKRLQTGSHHNLEKWVKLNKESLSRIVTNPSLALDTLESFVNKYQSKDSIGKFEIRSQDVMDELVSKGLTRLPTFSEKEIIDQFKRTSAIGRNDWKRTIAGQKIIRAELNDTLIHIQNKKSTILIQDRPGSGKTCLLLDLADALENNSNYQLLFIKGDRFTKVNTDNSYLPKEIVESCGLLSFVTQVVVVIDSLDVLSCQRDYTSLNYFLKLIDQLQIIQNVTIVAACREFDLKYDPRLRDRKWDVEIKLKDFDFQDIVLPILNKLVVNAERLNPDLKELLRLPQNLSLFEKVSGYKGVFDVRTTYDLYNAFIDYTLKQDPDIEEQVFEKIFSFAEKLLKEREFSFRKTVVNINEQILHNLISKGVLNEESDGKIGFSHQTLFDNFVAGNALKSGISLSELILKHPPLPFYRPSVRSYLFFVRGQSFKAFSRNFRDTLSNNEIAYHFKRLIVETYSEMIPTYEDWNLINWMFKYQNELFRRFFWALKSSHWFELIINKWYPSLTDHRDYREWYSSFISKLDVWMNLYPTEIVEIWNNALKEDWGKEYVWIICHDLVRFKHYQVEGVKELISMLRKYNYTDSHFMGTIYCNYIEATGTGYEILWDWMTRDISVEEQDFLSNKKNELYCDSHDLIDGNFLKMHLINSEEFLDLVLKALLIWVEKSNNWTERNLTCKLLEYTSIPDSISRYSSIRIENIRILIKALEEAILYHAQMNSDWWKKEEGELRKCNELAIRYILIKAYLENIEVNLDGIIFQLLDKELYEYGELNYELGLLINNSFHLLSAQIQDNILTVIENKFSEHNTQDVNTKNWHNRVKYDFFIQIPACLRAKEVNDFIDKFTPHFGYYPPTRPIYSRGGIICSPVSAENMDNLSIEALYRLLNYYKNYSERSFHPADGMSGGLEEIKQAMTDLAMNNPIKYISLIQLHIFDEFSISKAILEGIGYHIRCRIGKLNSSNYKPHSPLPEIK